MDRDKLALLLHDFDLPSNWTPQSAATAPRRVALVNTRGEPVVYLHPDRDRDLVGVSFETAESALDLDLGEAEDLVLLTGVLGGLRVGSVEVFVRSLYGHRRTAAHLRCGTLKTAISTPLLTALLPGRWERLPPVVSAVES